MKEVGKFFVKKMSETYPMSLTIEHSIYDRGKFIMDGHKMKVYICKTNMIPILMHQIRIRLIKSIKVKKA
jgi:hypothetical protein